MMSKKKWCILFVMFILYLLAGAGVFYNVENNEEHKRNDVQNVKKGIIEDLFNKLLIPQTTKESRAEEKRLFSELSDYCGKPVQKHMKAVPDVYHWDYYHSVFFVITVVTTIGYGNLAPTTMFTRLFMIFYGLIGIPMNGIVMVTLGSYFAKSFTKLYQRWKNSKVHYDTTRLGLISQIFLYLIPGFTFFIFLPAACMVLFENWPYDLAVYYCFVTLTTIGFGDYVAGVDNVNNFMPTTYWTYKVFLIIWILGGLGYLVMIIGFLTQAMKSKRVRAIEHILSENIKKTPIKIRQELRSLLQEFLFLKVKPVYKDFDYIPKQLERSQSCPHLTIYRNKNSPSAVRKRAFSEGPRSFILHRIQSDTELDLIDKERTFQFSENFMQQKDLLQRVVDALSVLDEPYTNEEPSGYHNLTDSQILASEKYGSFWSLRSHKVPEPKAERRRAVSDIRAPMENPEAHNWWGPHFSNELSVQTEAQSSQNLFSMLKNKLIPSTNKQPDVEQGRRASILSNPEGKYTHRRNRGRISVVSSVAQETVLEQTSIADFIRALTAVTTPESLAPQTPKRKLGNAGLSTDASPPRARRLAIRPNVPTRRTSLMPDSHPHTERRLSLRPVDEHLLAPPPYSLAPPNETRQRRYSVARIGNTPLISISPVQKQVNKRDNTGS